MRLLIVNPNTSVATTQRIAQAAEAVALDGDVFDTRPAAFGPRLIVTQADEQVAAQGVVAAIRACDPLPDGIVLASFGDTGAEAVRALCPQTPVIGIAQAAFTSALKIGGPFAIVTFSPDVAPPLRAKAIEHGADPAMIRMACLPDPVQGDPAETADNLAAPLGALCTACAAQGARSVVLGGGPLAGLASRINPTCPIPVLDGTQEAIGQMRARLASARPSAQTERERS